MRKEINIGGKQMVITSSAFTMFSYKNLFQGNLLEDLSELETSMSGLEKMSDEEQIKVLQPILEKLLRMAYIMNDEAEQDVPYFQEWLKGIKYMFKDRTWIKEVMEVASSCFLGNLEEAEQPAE